MADIELRSLQAILGSMVSRLKAKTDITDFSPGSVQLTILEAASSSDFLQEAKLIQLLNIRNLDKATGSDLENLAFELGVSPTRISAAPSQVSLTISESAFSKIATNIYAGATAPANGDTVVQVIDASQFNPSGVIFLGRGTQTAESINYISVSDAGSFWTIHLASPLTKDHLVGEEVVMAQGGDRVIPAGTTAFAEGQSGSPAVNFTTQVEYRLLDGEDVLNSVLATATTPGGLSNVGIRKINQFQGAPWSTAVVTNLNPASAGRDPETDAELRQRIKDHVHALSGGTLRAIIRSVIGIHDDEENKRVVSAFLRQPTVAGAPTILFIDDGTGFAPSFSGVGEEVVVTSAVGTESFLQLQQWPLVKAQVASVGQEPFNLVGGESLYVEVDGQAEEFTLSAQGYRTPGIVTAQEVAENINRTFLTIEARAKNGQLFITPTSDDPDWIRVGAATLSQDANTVLRFPTRKQYTLRLYKNDRLLEKNGSQAIIQSLKNFQWTGLTGSESLQLNIDGIDSPIVTFTNNDFATYTTSSTLVGGTVTDWATLINRKFIGVTATARDDGTFLITSNRGRDTKAFISVIGGTLALKLFSANSKSSGFAPEYKVNRLLGQIELSGRLSAGDELKAGNTNTRGFVLSSAQAAFNLSSVMGSSSELVIIADGPLTTVPVAQLNFMKFDSPASGQLRVSAFLDPGLSVPVPGQFSNVQVDDFAHLYNVPRSGLLRVLNVAGDGSSVIFSDPNPQSGSVALDGVNIQIIFFRTSGLPQKITLPIGSAIGGQDIVDSLNRQALGTFSQLTDTGAIKFQTTRFSGDGALSIASIGGNARNLGISPGTYLSNDPHTASIESSLLTGIPSKRLLVAVSDNVVPFDDFQVQGTPFVTADGNRPVLHYQGSAARIIRQPSEILGPSEMIFREDLPIQAVGLGSDLRATTLSGMEFGQNDNMVFLIDNNPSEMTFDIPMFVEVAIQGPSVPSTTQMDLADSTGAALGTSQRWLGHRFEDYRVWFQAKGVLPSSVPNSQLKVISVPFGPNGEKIRVGVVYPTVPSSPLTISFSVDPTSDQIFINAALASGTERTIGLQPNRRVDIQVSGTSHRYVFLPPVDLSAVVPGDILSLSDPAFNPANQGQMLVSSISNLTDAARAYQFSQETIICDVSSATAVAFESVPNIPVRTGDTLQIGATTRLVTVVTDPQHVTVASPGFSNGLGQSGILIHKQLTASSAPGFVVAVGDRISIGGLVLTVTGVLSATDFDVDQPFSFQGLMTGVLSRITITGNRYIPGITESVQTSSTQSIRVFALSASDNKASKAIDLINSTAGVKDLISVGNAPGSDGSGSLSKSTEDELAFGNSYLALQNGEGFVFSTSNASPSIRLKSPIAIQPEIGDKVRLLPSSARNIADHFSKKQVTGLTVAANVDLVDEGRRLQISSRTPGGLGQVFAVGGRASGQIQAEIRGTAQEVNANRAQVELDKSSIDLLSPGHTVKLFQTGRAKKHYPAAIPTASTTLDIQVIQTGVGQLDFGVPLVTLYPYIQSGPVTWIVRNIGRARIRFEIFSGSATIPGSLKVDDWVLIGNGSSYAGVTTDAPFAPANQGWFQVRETDNSTYFDVDGVGVEQYIQSTQNSFIFTSYHSARVGDQIAIGFDAPVSTANKGTFPITAVPSPSSIVYKNPDVETEISIALGSNGTTSIGVMDQGYTTYRRVILVSPKPADPTNRSLLVVSPGYDLSLLSEGQGAKLSSPNRLGFGTDPVPGVAGYSYWTGLKRRVQRAVDGFEPDSSTFPGVGAAGVSIEAREPQIQRIKIGVKVKTSKGVSVQSISDTIKNAVSGYVNSLDLGHDVVMSEVISLVQQVPGVDACVLTFPTPGTERITVGDSSIARISANDITLS